MDYAIPKWNVDAELRIVFLAVMGRMRHVNRHTSLIVTDIAKVKDAIQTKKQMNA
jgi:hypothetical protein